eukprot:TRINITY_DN7511_c0_g1_i1.p1 TRINITY_DN7511_c0_g1~~TRINITY_DN7511_c0_g1_i1.p1  ORF type:complete len:154 (+),score=26.14 TRINITY_DN7511_c0_g1_i1:79-540(+)
MGMPYHGGPPDMSGPEAAGVFEPTEQVTKPFAFGEEIKSGKWNGRTVQVLGKSEDYIEKDFTAVVQLLDNTRICVIFPPPPPGKQPALSNFMLHVGEVDPRDQSLPLVREQGCVGCIRTLPTFPSVPFAGDISEATLRRVVERMRRDTEVFGQ